jgi:hypothetical protein
MKFIVSLVLIFSASFGSHAADYSGSLTGEELLRTCTGESANSEKCSAFIAGVRSGMAAQRMFIGWTMAQQKDEDPTKLLRWLVTQEPFCSTSGVTDQQVKDSFLSFMSVVGSQKPDLMQGGAGVGVLLAAQRAFPCS